MSLDPHFDDAHTAGEAQRAARQGIGVALATSAYGISFGALAVASGLDIWIEVDGGINDDTIEEAALAGVDCFVAGSAVYSAEDPAAAVESLRRQAAAASKHLRL